MLSPNFRKSFSEGEKAEKRLGWLRQNLINLPQFRVNNLNEFCKGAERWAEGGSSELE
jgi:hypothetical protein